MKLSRLLALLLALLFFLSACTLTPADAPTEETEETLSIKNNEKYSLEEIEKIDREDYGMVPKDHLSSVTPPAYGGAPYVSLGKATFSAELYTTESFETYAPLDELGRCGVTFACIGRDIMPTEEREGIGQVKPTGWHTVKYDFVDGKYLYNRCHLIGFQLTGENANRQNLVTGTRSFNVEGMLPFENMVADYVKETGNHVLYRVTPDFAGDNLVCSGVYIEAFSVEDRGEGIDFLVYCYNAEPGVVIDYATGESALAAEENAPEAPEEEQTEETFVLNTNTKKIHKPSCRHVSSISEKNREEFTGTKDSLLTGGYTACGTCKP